MFADKITVLRGIPVLSCDQLLLVMLIEDVSITSRVRWTIHSFRGTDLDLWIQRPDVELTRYGRYKANRDWSFTKYCYISFRTIDLYSRYFKYRRVSRRLTTCLAAAVFRVPYQQCRWSHSESYIRSSCLPPHTTHSPNFAAMRTPLGHHS